MARSVENAYLTDYAHPRIYLCGYMQSTLYPVEPDSLKLAQGKRRSKVESDNLDVRRSPANKNSIVSGKVLWPCFRMQFLPKLCFCAVSDLSKRAHHLQRELFELLGGPPPHDCRAICS